MSKKNLWIIIGVITVMIPVIITLCIGFLILKDEPVEIVPIKVINGGTIKPSDETAARVEVDEDGTTKTDAIYDYQSSFGYSLQYNSKYHTDFTGTYGDFCITNDDETVKVVIQPIGKNDTLENIKTKEDWDKILEQSDLAIGKCQEFNRTNFNGMDVLIANYKGQDESGKTVTDVLMAIFIGREYAYNYVYTAKLNAPETEQTQIGGILYTIKQ